MFFATWFFASGLELQTWSSRFETVAFKIMSPSSKVCHECDQLLLQVLQSHTLQQRVSVHVIGQLRGRVQLSQGVPLSIVLSNVVGYVLAMQSCASLEDVVELLLHLEHIGVVEHFPALPQRASGLRLSCTGASR